MNAHSSRSALVVAAGLLALAGPRPAVAATHNVPEDFETITEAIEAAEWGDEIVVGPGVYKESLILTDQGGDGLILRSSEGPAKTSIQYGEVVNQNEAVITLQRCSNSTQIIGFSIDGRNVAKRGILANSGSRAVLVDLVIDRCEYGVAAHRNSTPYLRDCTIQNSLTAGLFIQGGSADVKGCRFSGSEKFGVYIRGTGEPVVLRDCSVTNNGQVGVQATDGEFSFEDGVVMDNGDTGMILQDVSPEITNILIQNQPNVGVVMDASSAVLRKCTIRDNNFGAVVSIDGQPQIYSCTFENNPSYHLGIEGDADPIVGGSAENANRFLGEPAFAIQSSTTAKVVATHNYWDKPCVPAKIFQVSNGKLKRKPWMTGDLLQETDDCSGARTYNKKLKKGTVTEDPRPTGATITPESVAVNAPVPAPRAEVTADASDAAEGEEAAEGEADAVPATVEEPAPADPADEGDAAGS